MKTYTEYVIRKGRDEGSDPSSDDNKMFRLSDAVINDLSAVEPSLAKLKKHDKNKNNGKMQKKIVSLEKNLQHCLQIAHNIQFTPKRLT